MSEPTVQFAELVYGGSVPLDDPAETYHEASRLYPSTALAALPGLALLAQDAHMRESTTRSSRRHPHREGIPLARRQLPPVPLRTALRRRVSALPPEQHPLPLATLATILAAAYAVHDTERGPRRAVPSAGALYPLELYAVCLAVDGAAVGLHHYDPFAHRLALLRPGDIRRELSGAHPDVPGAGNVALALVVTAVFWRSRFKYGQRGYRFALLEAGHVAQNVLLACAALRLQALPVGGFYDRRLDALVGIDGADESSLYLLLIGGGRA